MCVLIPVAPFCPLLPPCCPCSLLLPLAPPVAPTAACCSLVETEDNPITSLPLSLLRPPDNWNGHSCSICLFLYLCSCVCLNLYFYVSLQSPSCPPSHDKGNLKLCAPRLRQKLGQMVVEGVLVLIFSNCLVILKNLMIMTRRNLLQSGVFFQNRDTWLH